MAGDKVRVAILGGGVGAMSAAFALTEIDPKGEKYDITVYQLGWRLGGKCANGRNAELGQRIEEHGLHIWGGFYENAFTIMRIVFKALNRDIGDAFKRQNQLFYGETVTKGGLEQWLPWPFWMQPDKDPSVFPGRDNLWTPDRVMPTLSAQLRRAIGAIIYGLEYYWTDWPGDQHAEMQSAIARMLPEQRDRLKAPSGGATKCHPLLALAREISADLESAVDTVRETAQKDVLALLTAFRDLITGFRGISELSALGIGRGLPLAFQRALSMARLGIAIAMGMLKHGCLEDGLEVLDPYDFCEFVALQDPGVLKEPANKALVTAFYEYVFGYENGSRDRPRLSACAAIQGLFRMFFTYKGAFFFKATAGMGDTVFGPLYRLLKQRGVAFKFFHKVTGLEPTADGTDIDAILIDQQVALVPGPEPHEYRPLI